MHCLRSVPGRGMNVFSIINFIVVVQKSVRTVGLFSLLLDGENTFSKWAASRGQIPVYSRDPSPQAHPGVVASPVRPPPHAYFLPPWFPEKTQVAHVFGLTSGGFCSIHLDELFPSGHLHLCC